jgi:hypothetical protein
LGLFKSSFFKVTFNFIYEIKSSDGSTFWGWRQLGLKHALNEPDQDKTSPIFSTYRATSMHIGTQTPRTSAIGTSIALSH